MLLKMLEIINSQNTNNWDPLITFLWKKKIICHSTYFLKKIVYAFFIKIYVKFYLNFFNQFLIKKLNQTSLVLTARPQSKLM
jgi:hypothetical protein